MFCSGFFLLLLFPSIFPGQQLQFALRGLPAFSVIKFDVYFYRLIRGHCCGITKKAPRGKLFWNNQHCTSNKVHVYDTNETLFIYRSMTRHKRERKRKRFIVPAVYTHFLLAINALRHRRSALFYITMGLPCRKVSGLPWTDGSGIPARDMYLAAH